MSDTHSPKRLLELAQRELHSLNENIATRHLAWSTLSARYEAETEARGETAKSTETYLTQMQNHNATITELIGKRASWEQVLSHALDLLKQETSNCGHTRDASSLRADECAECLREQVKRLSATTRKLRDSARGLCEAVQEMRGVNFEAVVTLVLAIEQSEGVLPSQGLCTTMLSTEELNERNRTTRR